MKIEFYEFQYSIQLLIEIIFCVCHILNAAQYDDDMQFP